MHSQYILWLQLDSVNLKARKVQEGERMIIGTKNKIDQINEQRETDPKEIVYKHDLCSKSHTKT